MRLDQSRLTAKDRTLIQKIIVDRYDDYCREIREANSAKFEKASDKALDFISTPRVVRLRERLELLRKNLRDTMEELYIHGIGANGRLDAEWNYGDSIKMPRNWKVGFKLEPDYSEEVEEKHKEALARVKKWAESEFPKEVPPERETFLATLLSCERISDVEEKIFKVMGINSDISSLRKQGK